MDTNAFEDFKNYVLTTSSQFLIASDFQDNTDALWIFDLKKAHCIVVSHDLKESYKKKDVQLAMQELIENPILELSSSLFEIVIQNLSFYKDLGIILKEFGQNTVAVEALYEGYDENKIQELVESIARAFIKDVGFRLEGFLAKGSAYIGKSSYTEHEAIALVQRVLRLQQTQECGIIFDQKAFTKCREIR